LAKKEKSVLSLQLREGLAQQSVDEFDRIYEIFAEESRKAVEELTRKEFQHFVRSASGYSVALSPDYSLEVLDSIGNRALQRLSMGQSQSLSLAFITAISRVSEKNPPLVIDMPFGRLDPIVHNQISQRLPDIASQIILFLIPQIEWNDVTKKNLKGKANHIYEIEFDETKRESTLHEIGI
jgi:DNA sulfur modification protein DndD